MEQPNYYAIIPAEVRYDKELSDKAKLLYGEISCLTKATGFCWATNKYFASLYNTSERTITRLLAELADKEYIHMEEKTTKEVVDGVEKFVRVRSICLGRVDKNVYEGVDKNVLSNNTSNNNIKEIYKEKVEPSKEEEEEKLEYNFGVLWEEYPRKKGKAQAYKHYKAIMKAKKISNEEILNAIEAYKEEIRNKKTEEQYIMHGSTFFCSGIYDYLLKEE